MRKGYVFIALVLAGCAGAEAPLLEATNDSSGKQSFPTIRTVSCEGPARVNCKFINSPVKLSKRTWRFPGEPYPYYRTRNDLKFINAAQDVYVAPRDTWTDGASIPVIFVPIIGNPRSREFMNAATVHDAYSSKRNENGPYYHTATWQEVHRMFYDGLLASGTPPLKAKIMYAAVYLGGPRWNKVRKPPARQALRVKGTEIVPASNVIQDTGLRKLQSNVPLPAQVPVDRLVQAFKGVKTYIETRNPSIDELETHLTRVELDLTGASQQPRRRINFRPGKVDPRDVYGDDGGVRNDGGMGSSAGQGDTGGNGAGSNDAGGNAGGADTGSNDAGGNAGGADTGGNDAGGGFGGDTPGNEDAGGDIPGGEDIPG